MSLLTVAACLIGVLAIPTTAAAGGWNVVTGRNDADCAVGAGPDGFMCDSERLQAAVDEGGKIKIRGTFNLGEPSPATAQTVFITKDVNIKGQNATIYGGYNSLTIGIAGHAWLFEAFEDWAFVPEERVPVAVTVKNVRFENFLSVAIYDVASTALTVKDNKFVDAMPVQYRWPWQEVGTPSSYAVLVTAAAMFFEDGPARSDISGKVTIQGNHVDGRAREEAGGYLFDGAEWKGLGRVFRVTEAEADVTIKDNVMVGFHEVPIILDGIRGKTVVKDNVLRTADHGYDRFLGLFQIFEAGFGLDFGAPLDPSEATTIIEDNEITATRLVGDVFVVLDSDEVVIKNNEIDLPGGVAYDVFALVATADSQIKDNEIEGFGPTIGVYVFGSTGNTFKDNDTEDFTSLDIDFFADASSFDNTTYLEEGQTYFDEIPGNNIWIYDD